MATRRQGAVSRLVRSSVGVGELVTIVREMSFDELREEAQAPPRLLLVGADRAALAPLRDELGGAPGASFIDTATFDALPPGVTDYDGIVLVNAAPGDRARPEIRRLLNELETGGRTLTFQVPPSLGRGDSALIAPPPEMVADLRHRLVARLAHRQLALGRYLPAFRRDTAIAVINATSRANAEFAFLSNIPAVLPVVGNIVAAGADFLVLTKNQLMLIYKLAAIHGRDIRQPWRLYTEMLPVVGAGILWRTVARELASFIPFAAGTIPKVLVAYAGTAVTGQAAHLYYERGERLTREQFRQLYVRAAEMARSLPLPGRGERSDVIEGRFTEKQPEPAGQARDAGGNGRAPAPQEEQRTKEHVG